MTAARVKLEVKKAIKDQTELIFNGRGISAANSIKIVSTGTALKWCPMKRRHSATKRKRARTQCPLKEPLRMVLCFFLLLSSGNSKTESISCDFNKRKRDFLDIHLDIIQFVSRCMYIDEKTVVPA